MTEFLKSNGMINSPRKGSDFVWPDKPPEEWTEQEKNDLAKSLGLRVNDPIVLKCMNGELGKTNTDHPIPESGQSVFEMNQESMNDHGEDGSRD